MFSIGFLRSRKTNISFSADLDGNDPARLREELGKCAAREGGRLATSRRMDALVALFGKLSPAGRARFAEIIERMDEEATDRTGASYSNIEFAEFVGRASSRMAFYDLFERPRRRVVALLADARGGRAMLAALREAAGDALQADIDEIMAE